MDRGSVEFGEQPTGTRSPSQTVTFVNARRPAGPRHNGDPHGRHRRRVQISGNALYGRRTRARADLRGARAVLPRRRGRRRGVAERGERCDDQPERDRADWNGHRAGDGAGRTGRTGRTARATGPAGPAGPAGARPTGPAGTRGPAGPQGPPGQVICRNTVAARAACELLFPAGTWRVAGSATTARVTLSRNGRVYARGKARLRRQGERLRITLQLTRRPRPGTYRLTLRGRGVVVLRRTVQVTR